MQHDRTGDGGEGEGEGEGKEGRRVRGEGARKRDGGKRSDAVICVSALGVRSMRP